MLPRSSRSPAGSTSSTPMPAPMSAAPVAEGDPDAWDRDAQPQRQRRLPLASTRCCRTWSRRSPATSSSQARSPASSRWSGSRSTPPPSSRCRPSSIPSAARSPSTACASAPSLPGPVVTALLDDWPKAKMDEALANGSLMQPEEVAEAVLFMLTRPRDVTIRDLVILPLTASTCRMPWRHFIGIDVGTGSARAGVFDASGTMLGVRQARHRALARGRRHRRAVERRHLARRLRQPSASAVAAAGVDRADVRRHRLRRHLLAGRARARAAQPLPVGPSGDPARNIIVWMDHRAVDQAERINADRRSRAALCRRHHLARDGDAEAALAAREPARQSSPRPGSSST